MDGNDILLLGLGIQSPWQLVDQRLDTDKKPHELHLEVKAERGEKYACPECGKACSAHDFQDKTWRHLNFFQHHCYIHASGTPGEVFGAWSETDRGALGAQGQRLHAVV